MIAATLLAFAVMTAAQPNDPSRPARDAYTACLRTFMQHGVTERMSEAAFNQALPTQCADQERVFRQAIAARERSFRTPAAEVEQIAVDEITDARANTREMFAMSITPR